MESSQNSPIIQKVFLVGLSVEFTKQQIIAFFSKKYKAKFSLELKKKKNGRNYGWGVLIIKNNSSIYNDIIKKNKFTLLNRNFFAKEYLKGENLTKFKSTLKRRRIFLKGLPNEITNKSLYDFFSFFGELEDAYVIQEYENEKSDTSWNSSFGFVVFKELGDAEKILNKGHIIIEDKMVLVEQFKGKGEEKFYRYRKNSMFKKKKYKKEKKNSDEFKNQNMKEIYSNYYNSENPDITLNRKEKIDIILEERSKQIYNFPDGFQDYKIERGKKEEDFRRNQRVDLFPFANYFVPVFEPYYVNGIPSHPHTQIDGLIGFDHRIQFQKKSEEDSKPNLDFEGTKFEKRMVKKVGKVSSNYLLNHSYSNLNFTKME